jgi:hypothetical protein
MARFAEELESRAAEAGGEFIAGGMFRSDQICSQISGFQVSVQPRLRQGSNPGIVGDIISMVVDSTHVEVQTRYNTKDDFEFWLVPDSVLSIMARPLEFCPLESLSHYVDGKLKIYSSDENKMRQLLGNQALCHLLKTCPNIGRLGTNHYFDIIKWSSIHVLLLETLNPIKDVDELKIIFDLYAHVLPELMALVGARPR